MVDMNNPYDIFRFEKNKDQLKYYIETQYNFDGYILHLKSFLQSFDTPSTIFALLKDMGSEQLYQFIYSNLNSKCVGDKLTLLPVSFDEIEDDRIIGLYNIIMSFNNLHTNHGYDFVIEKLTDDFLKSTCGLAGFEKTTEKGLYSLELKCCEENLAHKLGDIIKNHKILDLDYGEFFPQSFEAIQRSDLITNGWTKNVIERDGKCMVCGETENIEAHHMNSFKNFPNQRADLTNGIALCRDCHKHYHRKYGYNNANAYTFQLFMKQFGVR